MPLNLSLKRLGAQRALFSYHRNVYLMLLFTLGKGFQISIAALTTNLYVYSLGYRQEFIGLVAAVPAIGSLLAAVPIGLLADRWGRKPVLVISGLLNPLALVAIALSTTPTALVLASLANGLLSGGYWVTNLPVLTESTRDDQRVGALALNSFLLLGVGALGALVGGFVPELAGALLHVSANSVVPLRWGLLAAAILVFFPALPLAWLREPRGHVSTAGSTAPASGTTSAGTGVVGEIHTAGAEAAAIGAAIAAPSDPPEPAGRLATIALFLKLLIPDALFNVGEGAVVGLLQIYFFLRFGLQPGQLGVLFTLAGLTGGMTSLLSPRLVRRWGSLRTATWMQYLSVPIMLLIGFAPILPVGAGAEFARRILRGFFDPVYSAFAMQSVSRRLRATLSGFYSTTWAVGYTLGPALAGLLQQRVSLSASFVVGAACVVVSATLLRVFFGAGRGGRAPAGA